MEVQKTYGDQVQFIGVPSFDNVINMNKFIDATGTGDILHLPDIDRNVWQQFGVIEHRTYVYIDDDGSWRRRGYGSLEADVEALIAQ